MKKKIIVLITILCAVLLTTTAIAKDFSDVKTSSSYYTAINSLSNLGILDGTGKGKFEPDGNLKRGEFAKISSMLLGLNTQGLDASQKFKDVKGHWASSYIKGAVDKGIIDGMTKTTFVPEGKVTYEQAVKMMVCTLGYKSDAEKVSSTSKNWSKGYFEVANNLKILKGLENLKKTQNLSRGQVSILVYNCLDVKVK